MDETLVLSPPSLDRTTKIPQSRVFKTLPRGDDNNYISIGVGGKEIEPSTPTTAGSDSKGNSEDFDEYPDRPTATRLEERQNRQQSRSLATRHGDFRTSSLQGIPSEYRSVENDIPFDQANDGTSRDMAATSTSIARDTVPSTPLRSPRISDFEDSTYSPVSTKFESIWLSSPEQSPARPTSNNAAVEQMRYGSYQPSVQPLETLEMDTSQENKKDELDGRLGRFILSSPRYSDPQPFVEPVILKPTPISSRALQIPSQYHRQKLMGSNPAFQTRINTSHGNGLPPSGRPISYSYTDKTTVSGETVVASKYQGGEPIHDSRGIKMDQKQREEESYNGNGHEQKDDVPHDEKSQNDQDTIFVFADEVSNVVDLDADDPDSPYKNVKVTHKVRRRTRQRREKPTSEPDDDTSTENYGSTLGPPTSLQERAHQAWKSRQKKNSSLRGKQDTVQQTKASSASVSFGASNTVHHFQPDVESPKDNRRRRKDEEDASLDRSLDRSLNSEYTKTLESEVEDMIKDILFIGSSESSKPGKRLYKDKPEVKRKLKQCLATGGSSQLEVLYESSNVDTVEDESTIPSVEPTPPVLPRLVPSKEDKQKYKPTKKKQVHLNDSMRSAESLPSANSQTRSLSLTEDRSSLGSSGSSVDSNTVETLQTMETFQSEKDGDDPFNAIVGFVEGGLNAMSSAIGFAFGDSGAQTQPKAGARKQDRGSASDRQVESSGDFNIFETCTGSHNMIVADKTANKAMTGMSEMLSQERWHATPGITQSSDSHQSKRSKDSGNKDARQANEDKKDNNDEMARQIMELQNGSNVSRLAIHAAHSVHKLQGVEYNEAIPIDMAKDLEMCSVSLKLPLGIIFMENDGGCFVTKVSPDGSAARSGEVEVGDQLACINGTSSIKMKVDDICNVIASSADPTQVDLIFIRYIGPFRPASKTLLKSRGNFRLDASGSFEKKTMSLWRKNPMKSNQPKQVPMNTDSGKKDPAKKKGFRLFGRGKN